MTKAFDIDTVNLKESEVVRQSKGAAQAKQEPKVTAPSQEHFAISVYKTPEGKYQVLKVNFDVNSSDVEVLLSSDSRGEANERFKIFVAKSGLLGN